jgi:hypothetical protein
VIIFHERLWSVMSIALPNQRREPETVIPPEPTTAGRLTGDKSTFTLHNYCLWSLCG